MSIFLSIQNHSQWGSVLFWTPLTFIVWTKTVKKKMERYCTGLGKQNDDRMNFPFQSWYFDFKCPTIILLLLCTDTYTFYSTKCI